MKNAIVPSCYCDLILEGRNGNCVIFQSGNLEFAVGICLIPLIHFVSDKSKNGDFLIGKDTNCFLDSRFQCVIYFKW
jgi:hypothetical protein